MKRERTTGRSPVDLAAAFVRAKLPHRPRIGIVLGSGMGGFANALHPAVRIRTEKIPNYPRSTVEGHSGELVCGKLKGVSLLVFQGRVHYYESGDLESVLFPVRVAHRLGIKTLVMTNAAGAVNREFRPGELMLMTDHINLTHENPLEGLGEDVRSANLYDMQLREYVRDVMRERGLALREGIYCGIKGPSYETRAEVEMIRRIGGDAIGMSTVNEASLARALGLRVAGISLITNLATGISADALTHSEVTEVAARTRETLESLLSALVAKIGAVHA